MKTRIILEMCCNHQGSMDIAKQMIEQAAKLGVWAVKFQKRTIRDFPVIWKHEKRGFETGFGETYHDHRVALEFNLEQVQELQEYAHDKGMSFICTAFDLNALIELYQIDVDYIKLPSQLLGDQNILKYCTVNDINNVIVSCGMHTHREIIYSAWLKSAALFMHCNSIYPHEAKDYNLDIIRTLTVIRGGRVGYSSHDKDGLAIPFAVLAGAEIIERHFTLDKNMKGTDHQFSSDFQDVKKIQEWIDNIELMLGDKTVLSEKEQEMRNKYVK